MAENVNLKLDDSLKTVHDGQQARLIRNYTEDWVLTHEEDVLLRAITSYRGGTLTDTDAGRTIAELSGLRAFKEDLQSKIRKATMVAEAEIGDS
jgi:hypothetical protein